MKTVCETDRCAGCMACVDSCPVAAVSIRDNLKCYNAVIDEARCLDCGKCARVCPQSNGAELLSPMAWHQGWAAEESLRKSSSSGGAAAAITKAFIQKGGAVCSCAPNDGAFRFRIAETEAEGAAFRGSRYVKSDPAGAYREMLGLLKAGKKVLFIALPCQVAAAKRFLGEPGNLYTVDLICHGTPSPRLLDAFLAQYGKKTGDYQDLQFRKKAKFQLWGDGAGIITPGVSDRYSLAFLNGLCYTDNCYACPYARKERVSDLTLGDSWGSDLPMEEQKKGISLLLCQTEKGKALADMAALELLPVDPEKAIRSNHQLEAPSKAPEGREAFFAGLEQGKRFNALVKKALPKACFRQDVKQTLIKLGLLRR